MIKEGKIGLNEAISISTIVLLAKAFYTNPSAVVKSAGTSGWYVTILSAVISMVLFLFIYLLLKRFPKKTLSDVFEIVWGDFLGRLISLIFISYFIFYSGSNLREFIEMIKAYYFPYTPPSIIIITFMIAVIIIAYLGFEVLSRLSYVGFWLVIVSIIIILILSYPLYRIDSLFPLGGYDFVNSIKIGVIRHSAYDELILLAFWANTLDELKDFKNAGLISLAISGTIISLVILCSIMAFDYTMAKENISNLFELSRSIYFSRFFQRLESIFLIVWIIASVILVASFFYAAISVFSKCFKINNHKPLIVPFAYLTFMITLIPENLTVTITKYIGFQRKYSSLILYLIPVLTLITSITLKKKGVGSKDEKD